jgi:DNA helicase-2/ATP-dependent DNA helicase PcrA
MERVGKIVEATIASPEEQQALLEAFQKSTRALGISSIAELLRLLEASDEELEQDVEKGKVNILTMHKAKGLTAKAVIVVAVEDEYLPGRAQGEAIGDERRLLYVSLTRAQHFLFVTYCTQRIGQQRFTGRNSNGRAKGSRSLSSFLRDAPISPRSGEEYVQSLRIGQTSAA